MTYQVSALAATLGVGALAIIATYLRFEWHMEEDSDIPWAEVAATLSLVAGGVVRQPYGINNILSPTSCSEHLLSVQFGMEMWARYAHKALWHEYEPGWALHKSHHEPRTGPFEVRSYNLVIVLTLEHLPLNTL